MGSLLHTKTLQTSYSIAITQHSDGLSHPLDQLQYCYYLAQRRFITPTRPAIVLLLPSTVTVYHNQQTSYSIAITQHSDGLSHPLYRPAIILLLPSTVTVYHTASTPPQKGNPSIARINPRNLNTAFTISEAPRPVTAYSQGFNVDTFLSRYNPDPVYGDSVNLRCDSEGVPPPRVTWYKDKEEIIPNGRIEISVSE